VTVSGALSEPRPFASLSPSLLARKGAARPAMRRQDAASFGLSGMRADTATMEDLGWNDWGVSEPEQAVPAISVVSDEPVMPMDAAFAPEAEFSAEPEQVEQDHLDEESGDDGSTSAPMASLAPEVPAFAARKPDVLRQIDDLAERINPPVVTARNLVTEGRRAAFTLRLDAERHFRLKMAGVLLNRSAQVIVTEALDKYLAEFADLSSPGFMAGTRS
jgi:hypothetical protein